MVAVLCALALVAVPLPASAGSPGSNNVDLRANPYGAAYSWGQETISVSYSSNYMQSGWNDRVSSLWVWSPVDSIKLFRDVNRTGPYKPFVYGTDDLRWYDWNDVSSSYTIYR